MKRLSLLVAAIAAFSTAACGSTAAPAAAADSGVAADSSDVVSVDVTAIDTETPDAGPLDTGKKDSGPKDTGPSLCDPKDEKCVAACEAANCGAEAKACEAASDCTPVSGCVTACKTQACVGDCTAKTSKAGLKGFYGIQGCALKNCVKSAYDGSCPDAKASNYQECQTSCLLQNCNNEYVDFASDPTALVLLSCLNNCKGDQGCQKGCIDAAGNTAVAEYQAVAQCATNNSCIGN